VRLLVLLLAACSATATPAFHPRPASREMTTPTMRIVQNDSTIVLIDRATGDRLPFSIIGELVGTLGDSAVALIDWEMRTRMSAYAHDQTYPFISDEIPFDIAESSCLLAVDAGPHEVLLGFGSDHVACDHGARVQHWVAVDLRTRHVRVLPGPQLAF
jgi:hypothetical protein